MATNLHPRHVEESCSLLMKTIRSTGLNYFIQDTPFSTYVTIRKSIIKLRTKIPNRTDEEPEPNPEEDFKYESLKTENEALKQKYVELLSDHENLKREVEETKTDLSNVKKVSDVKSIELKLCNDTVKNLKHEVQKLGDELCDTQIELTEQFGIVKVKNKEIDKVRKLNKELKNRKIEQATAFDEQNNEAKEQLKTQKASNDDLVVINKDLEKDLFKKETEETSSQTQSHPDIPYKHSSNRFEPLNQSEKDPNSLKYDPDDQSLSVSSTRKPNMVPTNFPSLATTSMTDMASPIASWAAVYSRDSSTSITGSPSTTIKATPAVNSSRWTSTQLRIPCDKCDRKCVNKKDMEMHIFLWHTDDFPL